MKKKIRNIVATVLSLAIAAPFALHADEPRELRNFAATDDINEATQLTTLDDEAIEELAQLGIDIDYTDNDLANQIIDFATQYLGRPYRHGAKGPSAFDCSGFTSYIFKNYGIELSPSSRTQATQGEKVALDEVRPGDLLFFGGRAGGQTVGHVALAVDVDESGTITFIHASTGQGITYNTYPDGGYYSKRYLGARRVLN